ncbi:hypothetical protein FKO01_04055 [Mesorhizobium sp. B2-3-3]|nr:hypothetical protein FKO01_04055 [Mesorhizobium sp. B2-3-3]
MPRTATVRDDTHREEQRRYRAKLRRERMPEVSKVDTAVAVGVHAFLKRLRADRKRSRALDEVLKDAVGALVRMDYDPAQAKRALRRRLVGRNARFEELLSDGNGDAHKVTAS